MGIAPATEKVIDRKKKKTWSGGFILCRTKHMSLSEKLVLSGIGETVKSVFFDFMDIDSRQHWFDPTGTKLPVVSRGPDSALDGTRWPPA